MKQALKAQPNFIFSSGGAGGLELAAADRRFFVVEISSSRPKSAIASRLAKEPQFARFLETIGFHVCTEEESAAAIRDICMVDSRADLDRYPVAASRFDALIVQPYALFRRMEDHNAG